MSTPDEYPPPNPGQWPPPPPPVFRPNRSVTGGELLSASWGLLKQDKELVLLPVLSSIFTMIAVLPFLGGSVLFETTQQNANPLLHWIVRVVFLFLTMFVGTTIAVFFQVALVAAVYERIEGGDPTLGSAIAAAWRDRWRIVQWAFLSAVVGLIIRLVAEKVGGIGEAIINGLAGVAWAVASLFVVPIIVAEGLGPVDALKESAALISRTWGKALRSGIRFGITQFLFALIPFGIMLLGVGLVTTGNTVGYAAGGTLIAVGILAMIAIGVFFNALGIALRAVLYRYAMGQPVPGIDPEVLAGAFRTKS